MAAPDFPIPPYDGRPPLPCPFSGPSWIDEVIPFRPTFFSTVVFVSTVLSCVFSMPLFFFFGRRDRRRTLPHPPPYGVFFFFFFCILFLDSFFAKIHLFLLHGGTSGTFSRRAQFFTFLRTLDSWLYFGSVFLLEVRLRFPSSFLGLTALASAAAVPPLSWPLHPRFFPGIGWTAWSPQHGCVCARCR